MIVYGNILRANKDSKTPLYINLSVIPGAGWGVKGAAFATALSQSIGGIAIFIAAMHNPLLTVTGGLLRPKWTILKDCIRVSMPLVGQRMVMGCGYVVFSGLVAGLGTLSVAAHSIALIIEQAFYVPGYGIQTAVGTFRCCIDYDYDGNWTFCKSIRYHGLVYDRQKCDQTGGRIVENRGCE